MEELAKLFIRHILTQYRETYIESWIWRALLIKEHPTVPPETWDLVVKAMKESPQAKQMRVIFDVESEKVVKAFADEVERGKLKAQIAEEEQKVEKVVQQLIETMSKLPPPKLPN